MLPRYKPPQLLAMTLASLDALSEGRLTLGVGIGFFADEFEVFGEAGEARVRAEKLDEGLEVITRLWSGDEVNHQGSHFEVHDVVVDPLPVQQPRIPIWVGGDSAPTLRRAARWDGWIGPTEPWKDTWTPEDLVSSVRRLKRKETRRNCRRSHGSVCPDRRTETWSRPTGRQVPPGGSNSSTGPGAATTRRLPESPPVRPTRSKPLQSPTTRSEVPDPLREPVEGKG